MRRDEHSSRAIIAGPGVDCDQIRSRDDSNTGPLIVLADVIRREDGRTAGESHDGCPDSTGTLDQGTTGTEKPNPRSALRIGLWRSQTRETAWAVASIREGCTTQHQTKALDEQSSAQRDKKSQNFTQKVRRTGWQLSARRVRLADWRCGVSGDAWFSVEERTMGQQRLLVG